METEKTNGKAKFEKKRKKKVVGWCSALFLLPLRFYWKGEMGGVGGSPFFAPPPSSQFNPFFSYGLSFLQSAFFAPPFVPPRRLCRPFLPVCAACLPVCLSVCLSVCLPTWPCTKLGRPEPRIFCLILMGCRCHCRGRGPLLAALLLCCGLRDC